MWGNITQYLSKTRICDDIWWNYYIIQPPSFAQQCFLPHFLLITLIDHCFSLSLYFQPLLLRIYLLYLGVSSYFLRLEDFDVGPLMLAYLVCSSSSSKGYTLSSNKILTCSTFSNFLSSMKVLISLKTCAGQFLQVFLWPPVLPLKIFPHKLHFKSFYLNSVANVKYFHPELIMR